MSEHLPPIRRVVTADDAKGNSRIAEDAPAASVRNVAARPGYRAVNVWRTEQTPAKITAIDTTTAHQGILPPRNGTILRVIDFPPEPHDETELRRQLDSTFGGIYKDALHVLVQRGTNHAWANRSPQTARIAFVLIDGTR